MKLLKRGTSILISLSFFASSALALSDDLESLVLDGNIYGHSTNDVDADANNKVAVVTKGSEAEVLETKPMRNGDYAVHIKITKLGSEKAGNAHVGETVWVYYSKKSPWIKFKDKDGQEIPGPEKAKTGQAQRDGQSLRDRTADENAGQAASAGRAISSPPQQTVSESTDPESQRPSLAVRKQHTEGGYCATCEARKYQAQQAAKNFQDLKAVPAAVPGAIHSTPVKKTPHTATQWDNYPEVEAYSDSTAVKNMIGYAMRNKAPTTKHRCYHYVKDALVNSHPPVLSSRPPSVPAKNALSELKQEGMINMMDDPRYKDLIKDPGDAPKGAVLVYTNNGMGHIEIKTGDGSQGGYVSDFYNKDSILGNPLAGLASRNYTLAGVFIKETPQ